MSRVTRVFAIVTLLALGAPLGGASASAGVKEVAIEDSFFTPQRLKVAVGSTVRWSGEANSAGHNVREDGKIFRSGAPTADAISYSRRFSAGTFHYYCETHGFRSGGMDGTVKVPVRIVSTTSKTLKVSWATSVTNTGGRFDVDYKVGSGSWKQWKRGVSKLGAAFGIEARPVAVKPGVRYSFRARSLRNGSASGWSPVRSFTL